MKTVSTKILAGILIFSLTAGALVAQPSPPPEPPVPALASDIAPRPDESTKTISNKPPQREERRTLPASDVTAVHFGGGRPVEIGIPRSETALGALIAVTAILSVFGLPVAVIAVTLFFRYRRNKMLHETLRMMVEKGVPIPPELLAGTKSADEPENASRRSKDLRNGLILVAAGFGITVVAGKGGLIVLLIGVALVIVALLDRRNTNQASK